MTAPTKAEIIELVSKRSRNRIKGSVRLVMPDTATLYVDETGAIESDQVADITLTADVRVFYDIAMGSKSPAKAFMMRQLKVDGNPMKALKIGEVLSTQE
ncbi:SCP-2 sterol transfer family protein [Octadecabacter temperatus]|uniref:SCP-2 sterol transfer family protein n=1 Tax=Octadecabacter temperatus TaxID=1458307 RepID=A0A0K0Y842_9RHOB|nr:SCP2 sterol-binding domain-containing protein [Octadecabacter temperatus]AKS47032.1 SCP-2 sterol transfer family protein [Octadecabacter temperatus]SIO25522.1 SCP-2 sterol transfer family protein [Octadecabacter temperatus]